MLRLHEQLLDLVVQRRAEVVQLGVVRVGSELASIGGTLVESSLS